MVADLRPYEFGHPVGPSLPGVAMLCRPTPAEPPVDSATLDRCVRKLRHAQWGPRRDGAGGPYLLTFANTLADPWLLGASAAEQNLPLVVAGFGRPFRHTWWLGYARKFPSTRRAAQILAALDPDAPVICADGSDTAIVNPLDSAAHELRRLGESVLVGSECTSWPICYREHYAADAEHQSCLRESHACYANAGLYLAKARVMDRWMAAHNSTWQSLLATNTSIAECQHDQGALHRIMLTRDSPRHTDLPTPRLDSSSAVFLNMGGCRAKEWRWGALRMCAAGNQSHEPLQHVRTEYTDGTSKLWFRPPRPRGGAGGRRRARPPEQRPFIAHANGHHAHLDANPKFAPLRAGLARASSRLRDHPVLLVDAYGDDDVCSLRSLGWLAAAANWSRSGPPHSFRTAAPGFAGRGTGVEDAAPADEAASLDVSRVPAAVAAALLATGEQPALEAARIIARAIRHKGGKVARQAARDVLANLTAHDARRRQ